MSGVVTRIRHAAAERLLVVERVQDVEPILERNKLLQTIPQRGDWGRHVACIPNVILERWINEEGVNYLALPGEEFSRLVRRKLRDPDWRHLRTDK